MVRTNRVAKARHFSPAVRYGPCAVPGETNYSAFSLLGLQSGAYNAAHCPNTPKAGYWLLAVVGCSRLGSRCCAPLLRGAPACVKFVFTVQTVYYPSLAYFVARGGSGSAATSLLLACAFLLRAAALDLAHVPAFCNFMIIVLFFTFAGHHWRPGARQ